MGDFQIWLFDLTNTTAEKRSVAIDVIQRYADIDPSLVKKFVFRAYFTPGVDVRAVIPLPEGCTMIRTE